MTVGELLAEREVLESQLGVQSQGGWNQGEKPQNHQDHGREVSPRHGKSTISKRSRFWRKTGKRWLHIVQYDAEKAAMDR